jgi:transposase
MTADEAVEVKRLAHARAEPARTVQRAGIVWLAAQGLSVPAIARRLRVSEPTVRLWLGRFNAQGLDGLVDRPRSGRPATYTPDEVSEVIATALTKPDTLGLPFGSWTLDRLQAYLTEDKGIPIKRSRIDDLLLNEGLRWRTQETWFGERAALERRAADAPSDEPPPDPEFARKRGRSSRSTRRRRRVA